MALEENENIYPETISKEAINRFPLSRYEGPIHLINNSEQIEEAVSILSQETLLGFDTETRPTFKKGQSYPVALLQLAGSRGVYIFQLLRLNDFDGLGNILSNPQIFKAGVAIRDDIRKLRKLFPFQPCGFVEISAHTQKMGIINTGLRSLTAIFLEQRVSKGAQVTNWSRTSLTPAQITYAATDAWISRELYRKLEALNVIGDNGFLDVNTE